MRLVKLALLSVIILFLIVTGISLFIPSHVRISKAINIKTVPDSVWSHIDDMRRWEEWNPFFADLGLKQVTWMDSANGKPSAVKIETTTVRWQEIRPDERITELTNSTRKPMTMGWQCIKHSSTDSITVQWYTDFRLRWYPWEKFGSMGFEKTYGTQMEKGLTRLKEILEK